MHDNNKSQASKQRRRKNILKPAIRASDKISSHEQDDDKQAALVSQESHPESQQDLQSTTQNSDNISYSFDDVELAFREMLAEKRRLAEKQWELMDKILAKLEVVQELVRTLSSPVRKNENGEN